MVQKHCWDHCLVSMDGCSLHHDIASVVGPEMENFSDHFIDPLRSVSVFLCVSILLK